MPLSSRKFLILYFKTLKKSHRKLFGLYKKIKFFNQIQGNLKKDYGWNEIIKEKSSF